MFTKKKKKQHRNFILIFYCTWTNYENHYYIWVISSKKDSYKNMRATIYPYDWIFNHFYTKLLTFTTIWPASTDNKLTIFFPNFPIKQDDISFKLSPFWDNLHEMSNPVLWGNKKKYLKMSSVEILPRVLNIRIGLQEKALSSECFISHFKGRPLQLLRICFPCMSLREHAYSNI